MQAAILALSTAVPAHSYLQEDIVEKMIEMFSLDPEKQKFLRRIYQNSSIHQRYSIIGDFHQPRQNWEFWGENYPESIPGMTSRNECYKKEAPKLAKEAAQKALTLWGGSISDITHVISVSCTGMVAPGIEYHLMQALGLSSHVNRLGINFMGCFGAFKGLSVAKAFALENPKHRILLVCTELCSLHLQASQDMESLLAHSLFADGAAAVVVGCLPQSGENAMWEMVRHYSHGLENSLQHMSWEASDHGFLMRLSPKVPVLIGRHFQNFANQLLQSDVQSRECDWPIHPGGKSILQAIEKTLSLNSNQTQASWHTLSQYGNMSSATFLFVLNALSQQAEQRHWSAGVAFGPGLSMEGLLLRRSSHKASIS